MRRLPQLLLTLNFFFREKILQKTFMNRLIISRAKSKQEKKTFSRSICDFEEDEEEQRFPFV